jgi:hypothetical protein
MNKHGGAHLISWVRMEDRWKPSKTEKGKALRWDNIRGVREVTLYAGGKSGVSHVRISVKAAPAQ